MLRTVIEIDREKCNGCGLCVRACHEGAIELIDGKAQLAREHFCDGLGDCLPSCPAGAITFVKREAPDYDAAAVSRAHGETAQLRNFPIQLRLVSEYAPFLDGASLLIAADCTAFVCPDFFERYARGRVDPDRPDAGAVLRRSALRRADGAGRLRQGHSRRNGHPRPAGTGSAALTSPQM